MRSHKKYVDDIVFALPEPDTLTMFLNSAIPAKAILAHYSNIHQPVSCWPRYPRRPYDALAASAARDFAEWTIAHTQQYEAQQQKHTPTTCQIDKLEEIFVGRWLRTRARPSPASPPLLRPRALGPFQSQKRYRPGPFGELRRPRRSLVGGLRDFSTSVPEYSLPPPRSETSTTRSPDTKDRSPVIAQKELLHSVGGVERILCHAAAYIAPCVYVFGGLTKNGCSDKMWSLLPAESGWRAVEPLSNERPSNRYGHTLVAWNQQLVLFGGDGGPGYLDDLWYFDTSKLEWDRISLEQEQEGRRPGARTGHSAVLYGDKMIVCGGWRGGDGFSDVWACDLEGRSWELLFYLAHLQGERQSPTESVVCLHEGIEIPEPRQWHICAIFGEYMYIHGGYGFGGVLRQVWRFHLKQRYWEFVPTRGAEPASRCRHSGVLVNEHKWIIFGGKDAEGSYFSDMFVLDLLTHTWGPIMLFSPPEPVPGATEWWNCPDILRGLPYLHCQATAYDTDNKCIVITGGCDGEVAAYDSTILVKRFPAAALLFDQWTKQRPRRSHTPLYMDLPEFLHRHPEPAAREILRFL